MPKAPQILKIRHARQAQELKSPWGRLGFYCSLLASLLGLAILSFGIWYYLDLTHDLPPVSVLPGLLEPPDGKLLRPTRLYDRSHEHVIMTLAQPGVTVREYLYVGEGGQPDTNAFSSHLIDATVASLQPGFWQESVFSQVARPVKSSPTIAQRLALDFFLYDKPASRRRNAQEWLLAGQIMTYYGREQVLEWYLNSAKYGDYVFGANSAAQVYLGKPATQLSIAEAALLSAISELQGYDPWSAGQIVRNRQVEIIQAMLEQGLISLDEAQQALKENVQLQPKQALPSLAPAFTSLVLNQLSTQLPYEKIIQGGFDIITTLDYELQIQVLCTIQTQVDRLVDNSPSKATETGLPCTADTLFPTLQQNDETAATGVNAEAIVLEPQSGEILAYAGGLQADPSLSLAPQHRAGGILLPFVYLTGFTQGMSPASMLWDLPGDGETTPDSNLFASYHGPVRLRTALVNDYPGAASRFIHKVGNEKIELTLGDFGIEMTITETASSASNVDGLFSSPVSLLDVVYAYGVLANQGVMAGQEINAYSNETQGRLQPNSLLSVNETESAIWLNRTEAQIKPIVSSQLAYLATNVLSDAPARTPIMGSTDSLDVGRPAAIKVSLSSNAQDAWSIGYIPQLAVGVWLGKSQAGLTLQTTSTVWKTIMEYASSNLPVLDFALPQGIRQLQVCDPSGLLVTPECPNVVDEVFLKGSEPTQLDDLYQGYLIDKQTGLLATVFTPAQLVEKQVFMIVPIEVESWAKVIGLPFPPERYDDIDIMQARSSNVQITNLSPFDYISGKTELSGSATGDGFSYYRIQVGKGLNPQEWLLVGQDIQQSVQDGILGTWDTTGLDGEYIIELLVVKQDRHVERVLLPVIIDNSPPQVNILAPKTGQQFSQASNDNLVIQVKATDNQAVERVEFWIDENNLSILYAPIYTVAWQTQAGEHTLQVKVYDVAGLSAIATVTFTVIR